MMPPPGVKEMATDKRARNDLLEIVLTAAIEENEVGGDVEGFDDDDWKEDYSGNKRGSKKRTREPARRSTHRSLNRMTDVDRDIQYYETARRPTAPTANFLTASSRGGGASSRGGGASSREGGASASSRGGGASARR